MRLTCLGVIMHDSVHRMEPHFKGSVSSGYFWLRELTERMNEPGCRGRALTPDLLRLLWCDMSRPRITTAHKKNLRHNSNKVTRQKASVLLQLHVF